MLNVVCLFNLCSGGEQDPVTAVSQIEDRIANNTAFKVNSCCSWCVLL